MFVPAMWSVWVALALVFLAVRMYVSRLAQDEDDQLILANSFERMRREQVALVSRVDRVRPVEHAVLALLSAMTLFVIVYYLHDMIHQFQ